MIEVDEQERAAYRAFVREHHPDRGGDPEFFVAGLAGFRTGEPSPGANPPDPGADDTARRDAPVEVAASLPWAMRVAIALIRTARQRRDRRGE
ncbi:MAG: hypothetical protein ACRDRH_06215 [Pseudonocardia sp.]